MKKNMMRVALVGLLFVGAIMVFMVPFLKGTMSDADVLASVLCVIAGWLCWEDFDIDYDDVINPNKTRYYGKFAR